MHHPIFKKGSVTNIGDTSRRAGETEFVNPEIETIDQSAGLDWAREV
jgi:hypothetical protein